MTLTGRPRGFGSDPPTGSGRVGLGVATINMIFLFTSNILTIVQMIII